MMNHYRVSRRHFLMGTMALALTACYSEDKGKSADGATVYPPELTGWRGNHEGSQVNPHAMSWTLPSSRQRQANIPELANFPQSMKLSDDEPENYDLIVVGSGVSGMASAYWYHQAQPNAKILILDNHDEFGGHARRIELSMDGIVRLTYGGSETLEAPSQFPEEAKQLLRDLNIDYKKFEQYFDQELFTKKWGLKNGVFFNQANFGQSAVVVGDPYFGEEKASEVVPHFPLSEADKNLLIELYERPQDYLADLSPQQKEKFVDEISYCDFLRQKAKVSNELMNYLEDLSLEYWGHHIDGLSVRDAINEAMPAVANLGIPSERSSAILGAVSQEEEPYIHHFPDGNASIVRMMVRAMIPKVATGQTMEDIVLAKFDYSQLDKADNTVRLRLNTTGVRIENTDDGRVAVYALKTGEHNIKKLLAKKCIFAGFANIAPHIVPEMPLQQREAMQTNVRVPMFYGKVLLKNAHAFKKLGVFSLYAPKAPCCLVRLDYPVSMGGYQCPQTPDEPIVVHMVGVPTLFQTGLPARGMYRAGRQRMLADGYKQIKQDMLAQLKEIHEIAGEKLSDVLGDVTLNFWAHGYSYEQVSLWDSDEFADQTTQTMQQAIGNIFMAGGDVAWKPYFHDAVVQAHRAVREALK